MWINGRPTSSSQISSLNSRGSAKRDIDAMPSMSLHDKASKLPFLPAYKARCNNGSSLAVSLMADAFSVWCTPMPAIPVARYLKMRWKVFTWERPPYHLRIQKARPSKFSPSFSTSWSDSLWSFTHRNHESYEFDNMWNKRGCWLPKSFWELPLPWSLVRMWINRHPLCIEARLLSYAQLHLYMPVTQKFGVEKKIRAHQNVWKGGIELRYPLETSRVFRLPLPISSSSRPSLVLVVIRHL